MRCIQNDLINKPKSDYNNFISLINSIYLFYSDPLASNSNQVTGPHAHQMYSKMDISTEHSNSRNTMKIKTEQN